MAMIVIVTMKMPITEMVVVVVVMMIARSDATIRQVFDVERLLHPPPSMRALLRGMAMTGDDGEGREAGREEAGCWTGEGGVDRYGDSKGDSGGMAGPGDEDGEARRPSR